VCHITILANDYGFFLLGLPIFFDYYTYHNMDGPYIGYIPLAGSSKPFLELGTIPTQFLLPIKHNYIVEYGPTLILVALGYAAYYYLLPKFRTQWGDKTWQFYTACAVTVVIIIIVYYVSFNLIVKHFGDDSTTNIPEDPSNI